MNQDESIIENYHRNVVQLNGREWEWPNFFQKKLIEIVSHFDTCKMVYTLFQEIVCFANDISTLGYAKSTFPTSI